FRTNGGNEYCGQVIDRAVHALSWEPGDHYRAIFIAGNEPFTQGPMNYAAACRSAIQKSIIVNTIHCGAPDVGRQGMWEHAAMLADGRAMNIDQNQALVHIDAPQDAQLGVLNQRLND